MKRFKWIAVIILSAILAASVCGCWRTKYDVKWNSHAEDYVSDEFMNENRVRAYYPNPDYIDGYSQYLEEYIPEYIYEKDAPKSRLYIITDEDEFKQIFTKYEGTIDFGKKMVILYMFPDRNQLRYYNLKNVSLSDKVLTMTYKLQFKVAYDSTMLYPRCFMVEMNIQEVEEVKFVRKG